MVTTPLIAIILGRAYFGHQELSLTVNALGSSMLITPLIAIMLGNAYYCHQELSFVSANCKNLMAILLLLALLMESDCYSFMVMTKPLSHRLLLPRLCRRKTTGSTCSF